MTTPHASPAHRVRADSSDEEDGPKRGQAREMLTAVEMLAMDRIDLNSSPASVRKVGKPKASLQRSSGEDSEQFAPQVDPAQEIQQHRAQHLRNESLHVTWTANDIQRMAKEISEETIADVHLSLLGYWICESTSHFEMAKRFIRELSLDQGYNINRIRNLCLRNLLISTKAVRPKEITDRLICKYAPAIRSKASYPAFRQSLDLSYFAEQTVLPLAMREQRERAMQGINPQSPMSSPIRSYPPDTPDRPQPLSVRSRHTGSSQATPTNATRSVSAPIANTARLYTTPADRTSVIYEHAVSHPLLATTAEANRAFNDLADADDVFGIVDNGETRRSNPMAAMRMSNEGTNMAQGSSARDSGAHPPHSARSESLYHDAQDTFQVYTTSTTTSIQASGSTAAINQHQSTRYAYTMPYPIENTVNNYRGTLRPRPVALVRRAVSLGCRPNRFAGHMHRALPLRSYESEAHLYPTAVASGASNHARTMSAGSMLRSTRPTPLVVETTPILCEEERNAWVSEEPAQAPRAEEQQQRNSWVSEEPTLANTLTEFSVPPMDNPVGLLPMHVSRATSIASTDSADPVGALAGAIQSLNYSADVIRDILYDTRVRGEELPSITWGQMSPFEQSWRELNEELLVGIYGRADTWLSAADVAYVDCVASEMAASGGHWVWELFRDEKEMF